MSSVQSRATQSCSLNGLIEGIHLALGIVVRDDDAGLHELYTSLGLGEVFNVRDEESSEFFWPVEATECGYVYWDLDHGEA